MVPDEKPNESEKTNITESGSTATEPEKNVPLQPGLMGTEVSPSLLNQAASPVPASSQLRSKILLLVIGLAVVVVAGVGYSWQQTHQSTPDEVFQGAISKLLSTSTVTQSASSADLSQTFAYDGSNIKDPKVSINVSLKSNGLTNKLSGYGTLKNGYLKYTSFGSSAIDSKVPTLVNKWIQLRKDGTTMKDVDTDSNSLVDPRVLAYGDLMVGNFSAHDRQDLLNYIAANKIYKYDVSHVTTSSVDGNKVYVYSVSENIPKLKELNKKVAAIMGVSAKDIEPALKELGNSGTTKLYIDTQSKQVVKYTTTQDGETITGAYTDYDTTSLPAEPKAAMTWEAFMQEESKVLTNLSADPTAATQGADNSAQQQV